MKKYQGLLPKLVVTLRRLLENDDLTHAAAYYSVNPDFYLDKQLFF